jgi:glycosyltransferase involved in cell wall biosynthesis
MKLIVMIPCLNEELTLPSVIQSIPRHIPGIDRIETLIIDDGSTDRTVEVARAIGVDHIVRLKQNGGLAGAFQAGVDSAIDLGADIIVNTDGDNQYPSRYIPDLVAPIIAGKADIVIGDRQTDLVDEFSPLKKFLQRNGSRIVRNLAGAKDAPDVVSGFRAFSRYAAARIFLVTRYSYTIESLMQATRKGLRVVSIKIHTNPKTRPSRLFRSIPRFLFRSGMTILRSYTNNAPVVPFLGLGALSLFVGMILGARYLFFWASGDGSGHVQSLILAATLIVGGISIALAGLLADLISANKRMLEELVWREKLARPGVMEQKFGPITVDRSRAKPLTSEVSADQRKAAQEPAVAPAPQPQRIREKQAIDAA